MKKYVLEEFKDKFSEIGSRIEIGEHPMLGGIIKEWTQLGVTMIELSEGDKPVNVSLSTNNIPIWGGIDFGRESFELPGYIIGKDLCVQGIEGKMNLESVSTEELVSELIKRIPLNVEKAEEFIRQCSRPIGKFLSMNPAMYLNAYVYPNEVKLNRVRLTESPIGSMLCMKF
ncbi:hypothetical protein K5V21_06270 [Clostridium sardiniense]|uniref:Uncharacterized protein n=1 Tax=Clostridium sardiniense TaxID=29369 RepID=A0ABS7KWV7_CLOSR|nr:hypothetical protein [Clostridium sardiniense]MBY0755057.1 hypothetical protein [Clostridium sardiniense]MDQ0459085.1 hypothetical protein [Clostridium sardiniense]